MSVLDYEGLQDDALLARAGGGDQEAFAALYDRLAGPAFSLACYILRDARWAEDVVQEAFVNIWRMAGSYSVQRGTVKAWTLAAVRNRSVDHLRKRNVRPQATVPLEAAMGTPGSDGVWDEVAQSLDAETVRGALAGLPDEQRMVLELGYFGGLSQHEIATKTGLPLGTVKSRMRLGLMKLRAHLAGDRREATT